MIVLLFAVGVFGYSFYQKNQLVEIKNVSSATLADPVQTPFSGSYSISFNNIGDDYSYNYAIKPLDDYKITGVVVSKIDHNPADSDYEKPIRYDLCIVWGKNVSEKTYLSPDISISQSGRYCNYRYSNNATFYPDQISNNHIITKNSTILDTLQAINVGDEISISGKLVDMTISGNDASANQIKIPSVSSTKRDDTGNGACESIYAESITILNPVHRQDVTMNLYSEYIAIGILTLFVLRAIIFVLFAKQKNTNRL